VLPPVARLCTEPLRAWQWTSGKVCRRTVWTILLQAVDRLLENRPAPACPRMTISVLLTQASKPELADRDLHWPAAGAWALASK